MPSTVTIGTQNKRVPKSVGLYFCATILANLTKANRNMSRLYGHIGRTKTPKNTTTKNQENLQTRKNQESLEEKMETRMTSQKIDPTEGSVDPNHLDRRPTDHF